LEPFEDRVRKAIRTIKSRGTWTQPQRAWLRRISEQLVQELVVDRDALDQEPFRSEGGFTRTSQDFATWTCSAALVPKYLMFAILAEGNNIRSFGEGSTHTTIYFPEIRALHICLAPVAEQLEIVRRIETAFAWLDRLSAEHANASRLLPKLNQAILAKAFRGELALSDGQLRPVADAERA
jgi:EcoEI R protein C-terminal